MRSIEELLFEYSALAAQRQIALPAQATPDEVMQAEELFALSGSGRDLVQYRVTARMPAAEPRPGVWLKARRVFKGYVADGQVATRAEAAEAAPAIFFRLDPARRPVLYTDSYAGMLALEAVWREMRIGLLKRELGELVGNVIDNRLPYLKAFGVV